MTHQPSALRQAAEDYAGATGDREFAYARDDDTTQYDDDQARARAHLHALIDRADRIETKLRELRGWVALMGHEVDDIDDVLATPS